MPKSPRRPALAPRRLPSLPVLRTIAAFLGALGCSVGAGAAEPAPRAERPNVVLVMADDMGYSDLGCYGGEIRTPNLDALAAQGLRFTQFYNTSRCCPTRASLLTGLYSHQAGVGLMMSDRGWDAYRGDLNRRCVTLAEVLRAAGYRTYMSGKWHVTRHVAPDADNHNWPLQRGFDRFYGTIIGAGSFYDPATLCRDNTFITPENDPEYQPESFYYTDAIHDNALRYLREHDRDHADEPFFLYVAHTCAHWPMHAPEEEVARYDGVYDEGFAPIRAARHQRATLLGTLEPHWGLSPARADWEKTPHQEWDVRNMQVYAAMIDRMDQGIGRLVEELRAQERLDDTLFLYLQDNGGCAEGNGRRDNSAKGAEFVGKPLGRDGLQDRITPPMQTRDGRWVRTGPKTMAGPEDTFVAYGAGWANVSNTPFRGFKHDGLEGGISTPFIVHWPAGVGGERDGALVHDPCHLIDVMPTLVEACGAEYPTTFHDGQAIQPMEGRSLIPSFGGAPMTREQPLCFEHHGNLALRDGRWKIVSQFQKGQPRRWQLYDMVADRSELNDLAEEQPQRLQRMVAQWQAWADRVGVREWPFPNKPKAKQPSGDAARDPSDDSAREPSSGGAPEPSPVDAAEAPASEPAKPVALSTVQESDDPPVTPPHDPLSSGGRLIPEQAAFDVQHYELAIEVFPDREAIAGALTMTAVATADLDLVVLDLHDDLAVESVDREGLALELRREHGRLWIRMNERVPKGRTFKVRVVYGGTPRVAPNPPWDGGFTWAKTPAGQPWIATSCQTNGADLWWPCKDHPSDRANGFDLHVTVPAPLICAANGHLVREDEIDGGRRRFHWRVSTPIQNYGVALNIAPYEVLHRRKTSVVGDEYDVFFWHLPSSREQAPAFLDEVLEHLAFFEEFCGPYPFRADKYGVVETPHLGMEHQSIVAYGNDFKEDRYGYDWLHHHELSHEWWANLVTCADWNDFWIHEGFGTYCQVLYTEQRDGIEAYHRRMGENHRRVRNTQAIAPREPADTRSMFGDDIYFKGCWVLHSLRHLIGDEAFFRCFRRMCYPDPAMERVTDGRQVHFATTEDFVELCERESGQDLGWFFELYLRQPALPKLISEEREGRLHLSWETPAGLPFPMPVEVQLGERRVKVAMPGGEGELATEGESWQVDPDHWILRQLETRERPRRGRRGG